MASWEPIEQQFIHGILLGYNITIVNERSKITWQEAYGKIQLTADIKDLQKFTKFTVKICGVTSKGCGVMSVQSVTTLEDSEYPE